MDGKEFVAWVMVIFVSLWGALYLETGLKSYFVLELFVILLLIIISVGLLYSIAAGKEWAWSALAVFFIASIINSIFVYSGARSTTPFVLTLFVNLAGLVIAASKQSTIALNDASPDEAPIPLYHVEERDLISEVEFDSLVPYYEEFERKKTRKRTAKKKSSKKKTKKIGTKGSKITKRSFARKKR